MKIVALAGGVGGAKLAYGFAQILKSGDLTIIVNTGDDFEHFGLYICPDIDTVCYNLANLADSSTGWGREDDSYRTLEEAKKIGGPDWFKIGDKDLGTHLERTRRLREGHKLSAITRDFCRSWGVNSRIIPMTDDKVATILLTANMEKLSFQEYFVHRQCQPIIKSINFSGIGKAEPAPAIIDSIEEAGLVVICPSNPWVSIDPMLNIKGIRKALMEKKVIALSPIIQGKALKGPAAKMFFELGIEPSAEAVANHYKGLIRGFVFDKLDFDLKSKIDQTGIISFTTDTIMQNKSDKIRVAKEIVKFSEMV